MAEIKYKKIILNVLTDLAKIRQSILLEKKGDKLIVENRNGLSTIQYHLEAPIEYFHIDSDQLGIFNYPEFNKLIVSMDNRVFEQQADKIIIKSSVDDDKKVGNSKNGQIDYSLSDSTTVKAALDNYKFTDADVQFTLDADEMKKINKMVGMNYLNSDVMQLSNRGDSLKLNTCNESGKSKSKWEEKYILTEEPDNDVTIKFSSDAFKLIPEGSYDVRMNAKCIKFELIDDKMSLELIIKKL